MKIKDVLLEHSPHMKLKVGCKNGTGYWYVGTVKDFNYNLDIYTGELRAYAKRQVERSKKALAVALKNPPTPATYARSKLNKLDFSLSAEDYMREVNFYFEDLITKRKTLAKREQNEALFCGLRKREVIDYFEADTAVELDPCLVVLIEGREPGGFWTTDESKVLPCVKFENEQRGEDEELNSDKDSEGTEEIIEDEDPDTDVAV